jgi:hypothetical protein
MTSVRKHQKQKNMKKNTSVLQALTLSLVTMMTMPYAKGQGTPELKTTLQQTVNQFDTAADIRQKQILAARLSMIETKWSKEWITHYYVAYSKTILSSLEKEDDKRDLYLDEADKERALAVSLLGQESDETHVLAALIANWRIAISPMSRSSQYAKIFRQHMAAAQALNPGNPRIYYLEGMAKYSMPKFVGGGKDVAMPYLAKADSLYARETNLDITKPYWGKQLNAYYLGLCRNARE